MPRIKSVHARQILDSRGQPTLEVAMTSDSELSAVFGVPAGASTGQHEAAEKRDGGQAYGGKGISTVVELINGALQSKLVGQTLDDQSVFDASLIENKASYGSNATLGLSGAYCRLSAISAGQPLWRHLAQHTGNQPGFPRLYANLVNGGKHAPGLDIQEIMIVPRQTQPSLVCDRIYDFRSKLSQALESQFGPSSLLIGDEGGYVPQSATHAAIFDSYRQIIKELGGEFDIALDTAASSFYKDGQYTFEGQTLTATQLKDWYLANSKDVLSVEDPFDEDDLEAHQELAAAAPNFFIVGDDTTVTSAERISALAQEGIIGGVIIKPNQVGTITETLAAIKAAQQHKVHTIISHRSGETNDDFIVDLAYGTGAFGLKLGAPARGERVAKYNRLLSIEESL